MRYKLPQIVTFLLLNAASFMFAADLCAYTLTRLEMTFTDMENGEYRGNGYIQFGNIEFGQAYPMDTLPNVTYDITVLLPAPDHDTYYVAHHTNLIDTVTVLPHEKTLTVMENGPLYWPVFAGTGEIFFACRIPNEDYFFINPIGGYVQLYIPEYAYSAFYVNIEVWFDDPHPLGTPVPEPASILLFGTGLLGAAGFRKKYKRHAHQC